MTIFTQFAIANSILQISVDVEHSHLFPGDLTVHVNVQDAEIDRIGPE